MKAFENIAIMIVMAALLVACNHHDDIIDPEQGGDEEIAIAFNVSVNKPTMTRGTLLGNVKQDPDNPNNDKDDPSWWEDPWKQNDQFSAYALYYFDDMTVLGQQFMYDQKVNATVSGTGAGKTTTWSYTPIKYWPQQGYLDMFTHYPSSEQLKTIVRTPDDHSSDAMGLPAMPGVLLSPRPQTRGADVPYGISSLRFWHENPLDTTITFRYYCLPASGVAPEPNDMDNPIEDTPVTAVFNDAEVQPDLMFAHRPHLAKLSVNEKVHFAFTHAMMGVRFWIRGLGDQDASAPASRYSKFKNVENFTINSISFGPVYSGGEVIAFDNTDWAKYYDGLYAATQYSSEPVKLRYLWNFGDQTLTGTTTTMTTPAYGGYRKKYNKADDTPSMNVNQTWLPIDKAYPIVTTAETFSQTCNYSFQDKHRWNTSATEAENVTAVLPSASTPLAAATHVKGQFPLHKEEKYWWIPEHNLPLLPDFDTARGTGAASSAFMFPPQFFDPVVDYIRVTFTMTNDDGSTLTHTLNAKIPMGPSDNWWDADRGMLRVEDGQILDIYFTFTVDGDEYFQFIVDAHVDPIVYGGGGGLTLPDW